MSAWCDLTFKDFDPPADNYVLLVTALYAGVKHDANAVRWLLDACAQKDVVLRVYYDRSVDDVPALLKIKDNAARAKAQLVRFACAGDRYKHGEKHRNAVGKLVALHACTEHEQLGKPRCVAFVDMHTVRTDAWWKVVRGASGGAHVTVISDIFDLPAFAYHDVACKHGEAAMLIRPERAIVRRPLPAKLWGALPDVVDVCELRAREAVRSMIAGARSFGEPLYEEFHDDLAAMVLSRAVSQLNAKVTAVTVAGDAAELRDRLYNQVRWNGDRCDAVRRLCAKTRNGDARALLSSLPRTAAEIVKHVADWVPYLKKMCFDARCVRAIEKFGKDTGKLSDYVAAPTKASSKSRNGSGTATLHDESGSAKLPKAISGVLSSRAERPVAVPDTKSSEVSASVPVFDHKDSMLLSRYDDLKKKAASRGESRPPGKTVASRKKPAASRVSQRVSQKPGWLNSAWGSMYT